MFFSIKREPNFKDIQRFMVKELEPRVHHVQKEIVKSISQNVLDGVQDLAPPELGGYEKNLHNVGLTGDHIVYAIRYEGKLEKAKGKDPETTVLYLRVMTRKTGKWTGVYRVLRDYGPFTLGTWPVKIPKNDAMIQYRTVDPKNVLRIRKKNMKQSAELIAKLKESGIRLSKRDFAVNPDKLKIIDDLAFKVIRLEKGLQGIEKKPHWKPALKQGKSDNKMDKILKRHPEIQKSLNDPNFRGWRKLGKIKETIPPSELTEIYEFQKVIAGIKTGDKK